jgi:hypothetical protein
MDLSKLTTEELLALKSGDLSKISTGSLKLLQGVPEKEWGVRDYARAGVDSIAEGAMLGYSQEAKAKVQEWMGNGDYDSNLKKFEAESNEIPTAGRIAGNVGGAIGATIATAPVVAAAGLGRLGAGLPNWLRFGGLGAAEGAITGSGQSPDDRVGGAIKGGAVGAVTGAATPYVLRGGQQVWNGIRNATGTTANVSRDLGRALARDNDTPQSVINRLNQSSAVRPNMTTLTDVGGENVRGLTERVAQTPGAGRTQVIPAIERRQRNQSIRIGSDLRELTGTARSATEAFDETITQRAAAARPLYERAMQFDAAASRPAALAFAREVGTGWGENILRSPALRRTLQSEYGIENIDDAPLMPLIDAWKKEMDDAARSAGRAGNNNQARVIAASRDRVLAAVDEANPDYAAARQAWGGPSGFMEQIDEGRRIFNVPADELTANFRRLPADQQDAYRIGAVHEIMQRIGNNSAKLPDVTKLLRSPEMRAKIAALMPDNRTAQEWFRRLEFETQSSEMSQRALGNSATARRMAEQDQAAGIATDLVLDVLSGSSNMGLLNRMARGGFNWFRDTLRSRSDRELADILINPRRARDIPNILNGGNRRPRPVQDLTNAAATVGAGQATY